MTKTLLLSIVLFGVIVICSGQELKTEFQDTQPKFIQNSDGTYSGICFELMKLIEKNSTIKFSYPKQFIPAKRMEQNIVDRITDVQFGYGKTPDRVKNLIFGDTLYDVDYILIANVNDQINIKSVNDIKALGKDCLILAVAGTANATTMKNIGLNVDSGAADVAANFQKLIANRGRLFSYHNLGLLYEINKPEYKGKFRVIPIVIEKTEHWVAFSRKTPQAVIDTVVDTIRKLKANGEWGKVTSEYLR